MPGLQRALIRKSSLIQDKICARTSRGYLLELRLPETEDVV